MSALSDATKLAMTHYENFPVAPFFLPKADRKALILIYAFARTADDIADEGTATDTERLAMLNHMSQELDEPTESFFLILRKVMIERSLSVEHFHNLLDAFKQDVCVSYYENHEQVLDYCQRSANPVGRLLLELCGQYTKTNAILGDALCTGLQLINFQQDVLSDWTSRRRLYIPLEDLREHGVTPGSFFASEQKNIQQDILKTCQHRAQIQLVAGSQLGYRLQGRFGWFIRAITTGGLQISKQLSCSTKPFSRPVLHIWQRLFCLLNMTHFLYQHQTGSLRYASSITTHCD